MEEQLVLMTLVIAEVVAMAGMAVAVITRSARSRKVGEVFFERREPRAMRPVMLAVLTGLAIVAVRMPEFPTPQAVMTLVLGAILVAVLPDSGDRACGDRGVVSGWRTVEYSGIEEWRLTGEHLRIRIQGEWTAVDVPSEARQRLRSTLEKLVPERESRFKH